MKNKRILWSAVLLFVVGAITDSTAQSGVKYPYVENGTNGTKNIVCRDGNGGVQDTVLLSAVGKKWNNTVKAEARTETNFTSKVSPKFAVATADIGNKLLTWWDATGRAGSTENSAMPTGTGSDGSVCPRFWRLPTQRELMLICILQGELQMIFDTRLWSSTQVSQKVANDPKYPNSYAWAINMELGAMGSYPKTLSGRSVRCVQDL